MEADDRGHPAPTSSHDHLEAAARLVERWPAMAPLVGIGAVCVVAGGLVAAVTRPLDLELGAWLAAFLVLVGGVAQIVLGAGQAWLRDRPPPPGTVVLEAVLWNLGLVATVAGSLAEVPALTALGGAAVVVALGTFLRTTWVRRWGPAWLQGAYLGLLALVLVSTPVGLALALSRHG